MFIWWGTHGKRENLGYAGIEGCGTCRKTLPFEITVTYTQGHLYGISMGGQSNKQYFYHCNRCQMGRYISESDAHWKLFDVRAEEPVVTEESRPARPSSRQSESGLGLSGLGGFRDFFLSLFDRVRGKLPRASVKASSRDSEMADLVDKIAVALQDVLLGGVRVHHLRIPESGGELRKRRLEINIPRGVRERSRIRIAGEGSLRTDGTRGDLYLRVIIRDPPGFERDGIDLITELEVPLADAEAGTVAAMNHIDGSQLRSTIPPETKDGAVVPLPGQGLPSQEDQEMGDLLVRVKVQPAPPS